MAVSIKRLLVGTPLPTAQAVHERLTKKTALAVFSSDALSSTAYATEEILLVLAVAVAYGDARAFGYIIPLSLCIVALIAIVSASYRQTIYAYPSGGGAYIVAKDNLGATAGLVAGASLLVDYVLTVAVSVSAGVAAITSAAQGTRYAWLDQHKVLLSLLLIAFIAIANLRGVRESGMIFSIPTYAFICSFLFMIGFGLCRYFYFGATAPIGAGELKIAEGYRPQPLTFFLLLSAFSNGCSALTGIEAISNGVQAFRRPESRNAATTLVWMALLLSVMFLGTSVMAYLYGVHPHANETVISQFARAIFAGPLNWFYYAVQATTAAILVLAANTSFADFPRLASIMARDRYLPRQLANRGDRLVYSNGIVLLALFASLLIIAFGGDTHRLIPLYAIGVFLSFTLSQAGMVRHWWREREHQLEATHEFSESSSAKSSHWRRAILINGLGACCTFTVLCVFVVTKFVHGAWLVVVIVPLLVMMFRAIYDHYQDVARQLSTEGMEMIPTPRHRVVVPISGVHRGVVYALEYAKAISPDDEVTAVYVDLDEEATRKLREKWERWGQGIKLVILPSPYRELTRPLLRYIERLKRRDEGAFVTVVIPEFVPARWWQHLLHNQSSLLLKGALLFRKGVVVTSVPYHLER
jgi:amino acid transporter